MHLLPKKLVRGLRISFVLLLFLFMFASCINPFAPKLEETSTQDNFITSQSTPEELFQNFSYAYAFRDSVLYADILDSAFTFEYFDPNVGESGAFESWGKDIEIRTTGSLFRTFDARELIWLGIIYENRVSDTEEIIYRNFRLSLVSSGLNFTLQGFGIFTFRKGNDGKWRILRWVDESNL
ncbi:MAG: hypothetical protein ACE5I1_03310 [bacterium]